MRRAHLHMSWSDSMASSVTLGGNRSLAVRPPTSRLTRGTQRMSGTDQTLRRLVQDLGASRIQEEPEDETENTPLSTNEIAQVENGDPELSTEVIEPLSRRKRVVRSIKTKTQQLLRLISYYIQRFIDNYNASASIYRPLYYSTY
ncbi:hypothetical protein GGH12_000220 [Coemansia sp. RSA 1822]|nr:hypothetical protein LPJ76_000219 [Coemansia sp. RSA 638]KAJ2125995.1 hypothetical protein IW147_000467 [Coemansia sp. RSA 720]KAJ2545839.1 hypothetical protein GGF49_000042 [Coemansia sp. RSA 1853]KAJ2567782.1 hypothetical protein GGH12_000220 [Coemansia sp. RSA 1822]